PKIPGSTDYSDVCFISASRSRTPTSKMVSTKDFLFLVTAIALVTIYFYFKWSYTCMYWKKRNVRCVKPIFPFGNFLDAMTVRKSLGEVFKDLYERLEGEKLCGMYLFSKPGLLIRDPSLIKSVMVKDFSYFPDHTFHNNHEIDPLTANLFHLAGEKWKNLRAKLTPTFTSGKIKMMFQILMECGYELSNTLQESAKNEEIIEVKDIVARYSTDVIASCAFGIQCNCLQNPNAEFRQWGKKFFEPSIIGAIHTIFSTLYPKMLDLIKMKTFDVNVTNYFRKMVQETVNYREENNIRRNDFMQLLIQLKNKGRIEDEHATHIASSDKSDDGLSMDSVIAQAFVFYSAGFETSSTTITFCLYELAQNPDIQERVREEIHASLRKYGENVTYDSIQEMGYLDKVVAETLRKYPALPFLTRECVQSYKIPGSDVVVDKGTPVVIPVLALHRDPKYYPDPDRFNPERFNEEEKTKRHQCVYLPFGEGPRICIGMRFGLMQVKVGLVSLLSRYKFCVCKKTASPLLMDPRISFFSSSLGGVWLQIRRLK
ncbi:hypothetical protein ANN_23435, partial [Periplaneta americana]